jgi:hypothetical protein
MCYNRVKFILDRKTLEKIYFTFVRPLLEYADVIWDNMSMSLNKKIENVQLEASRIVCVCYNRVYLQMLAVLSSLCSVASNVLSFCKI